MVAVCSKPSPVPQRRLWAGAERPGRVAGIVGAIAFHSILVAAMIDRAPVRRTPGEIAPIVVSLIAPEAAPAPTPRKPSPPPKARHQPVPEAVKPVAELRPMRSSAPTYSLIPVPPPDSAAESAPAPTTYAAPPSVAAAPAEPASVAAPPITPPRFNADYLRNPPPPYPAIARRMREQGKVLVRVLVGIDGVAERIELEESSGSNRLDQSALETIRSWKFIPARSGDQTVSAWVIVPITFTLEG